MAKTKTKAKLNAIRKAAREMFGVNKVSAERYIVAPEDDRGEWAPESVAVIYLEPNGTFPEDDYKIPDALGYYSRNGLDNCIELGAKCGVTVEWINAAVAACYE